YGPARVPRPLARLDRGPSPLPRTQQTPRRRGRLPALLVRTPPHRPLRPPAPGRRLPRPRRPHPPRPPPPLPPLRPPPPPPIPPLPPQPTRTTPPHAPAALAAHRRPARTPWGRRRPSPR